VAAARGAAGIVQKAKEYVMRPNFGYFRGFFARHMKKWRKRRNSLPARRSLHVEPLEERRLLDAAPVVTANPTDQPVSHEFVAVVDKNGLLHTYSWGNDLKDKTNPSHWLEDQTADRNAAKKALAMTGIQRGLRVQVIGGDSLDKYSSEAFGLLKNAGEKSPSAHGHGGAILNCKAEAERLTDLAMALHKADSTPGIDSATQRIIVLLDFGLNPVTITGVPPIQ
jgi:hypothetical protein